nr:hypothetical protein [Tanacetum cinerariifolium]
MVDYSLWEVIENGNKPPITKVVEGIPNEYQLKFNSIKDAKSLLLAVEKMFGGNAATKKTQRNLLKKQYENVTTSSKNVLDKTFDRLQKLISQLEIHGKSISLEDVNQKSLRSQSLEWNTHTTVWRNKPEIDILSLDDLYNNLKIYEPEMAMLTMRARRFLKNTGIKFSMNGNETIGFDKSKVECYNCNKWGHFARECRALRNQENKNRESTRRIVPAETPASSALVSYDGLEVMIGVTKLKMVQLTLHSWLTLLQVLTLSVSTVKKPIVETSEAKTSADKPKDVKKNFGPSLIKDWISDSDDEAESKSNIEKETVKPSFAKKSLLNLKSK